MDSATPLRARCHTHPDVAAVALCDGCGLALCLECAVPVRGETIGPECLAERVPETTAETAVSPPHPRRPAADRVAIAGLALALVASLLPWTRFGPGSSMLGAWGFSPVRHASAVGPLAVAGLILVWAASRPPRAPERLRVVVSAVAGGAVATFALLAVFRPVPFTRANLVPFVALAGGMLCALSWPLWARLRPDRSRTPVA